ncbi:MAG: MipA/OmpV family protein [Pseudomonadota bacterium]
MARSLAGSCVRWAGRVSAAAAAAMLVLTGPAAAQRFESFSSGLANLGDVLLPNQTQITLGVGPNYSPDYFGSDNYDFGVDTNIILRFKNFATVSNEGAEFNILGLSDFELGPTADITSGRDEDNNAALEGLGDIGRSLEIGAYGRLRIRDTYTLRAQYRHALTGHDGDVVTVRMNRRLYQTSDERLTTAAGIRWTWVNAKYNQSFFGVTEEQSERSGLPVSTPAGSSRDIRMSVGARWRFLERWALNGYASYGLLVAEASNAAIVDDFGSRHQFGVGANVTYTFNVRTPHISRRNRERAREERRMRQMP